MFELKQRLQSRMKVLLLVVLPNLFTFYIFTSPYKTYSDGSHDAVADRSAQDLLHQLNSTQRRLWTTEEHLSKVKRELCAVQALLDSQLKELSVP